MFKNIRIIHDKKSNTYDIEFMLFEQHFTRTFSRREVAEEFYNKILQVERKTDSTNKGAKEVCGDEINPYLLNGDELKKTIDFKKRY